MLGFSPLSSAPLSDDGAVREPTPRDIITGAPVVDAIVFTQNHTLTATSISAQPSVDSASIDAIVSNFFPQSITLGSPTVDPLPIVQTYALTVNDITASAPVVDSATVGVISVFNATSLGPEVTTFAVTVADNGGNKFFIDGVSNPTLALVRGQKYVFDVSDATNDGHPLRFKDGSGNSYSTGVTVSGSAGQSGATVTILVASDAPSSLRYYCTVHGNGMGNTISVSTSAVSLRPVVDNATVSVISNFVPLDITATPVVDALPFFQEYSITVFDIITQRPTLPARFVWDFQELEVDSWTNQADDDTVWTIQSTASDTWSEAA
jgi:hypothetical protein